MKASLSWLKDYVDIKMPAQELARALTMSGTPVEHMEKIGNDWRLEFEITANRSDCLSIIGIAREIAAVTGKKLKVPKDLNNRIQNAATEGKDRKQKFQIKIKNKKLCPRYTGRIITEIKVGPSPEWMQKKLISVGLRPVNNIVDITNFLLMETGQPMHAFDLDKIKGGVQIRKAEKEEKIKTIDNLDRILEEATLIIADANSPIAIAGIMGGVDTEVSEETKNILLESAYFDAVSVRRSSRKLGLTSESSYRFERKIDPGMILPASNRAALMIKEIAGGEIGKLIDVGAKSVLPVFVKFNSKKANAILGLNIPLKRQKGILNSLGFSPKGKNSLKVEIPSFRRDISEDVDIIEEVARIYGYESIPVTIPKIVGHSKLMDKAGTVKDKIQNCLSSAGLNEIITYNLVSLEMLKKLSVDEDSLIRITNPLSREQEIMTKSLIPGMLNVINWNINRKNKDLRLFEIGNIYRKGEGNNLVEDLHLSVAMCGTADNNWLSKSRNITFFDLKGILIILAEKLGINLDFVPDNKISYFSASAFIRHKGRIIGSMGKINREILGKFDVDEDVYILEVVLNSIIKDAVLDKKFKSISKFPSITRDISMVCAKHVTAEALINVIKEASSDIVKAVMLIDKYAGKQIPDGFQGILYRIEYRDDSKTLTDKAVEEIHNRIKDNLSAKLGVSFR